MKGLLDSMSVLKDCEAKDTLMNVVKDCFDNKDKAIANEDELTATLDSMWIDIHGDSLSEIAKAFDKLGKKKTDETVTTSTTDSDEKKDKTKSDDSKDEEKKDGCHANKDSSVVTTKDDVLAVIKDTLPALVMGAVKEVLGIKENGEPKITGSALDSVSMNGIETRDYSSFVD